jgi:transcription elongation factor Elf1
MSGIFDHWVRDLEEYGDKPKKKIKGHKPFKIREVYITRWDCPVCGNTLCIDEVNTNIRFCSSCGRRIDWESTR